MYYLGGRVHGHRPRLGGVHQPAKPFRFRPKEHASRDGTQRICGSVRSGRHTDFNRMTFERLFIVGLLAHIIADWFLQNDWMAQYKVSLKHPAAWIHSGIHFLCFWPVIGFPMAGFVFVTHILIDTRVPLNWWKRVYRMKSYDPKQEPGSMWNVIASQVAFWQDQMAHVLVIAIAAWFAAGV